MAHGDDAQVMRRLVEAAGRSGGALIEEVAATTHGWAVLVDPLVGPVYWSDAHAAQVGAEVAAGTVPPGAKVLAVAGALLVVGGGAETRDLAADTAAGLLRVRARRAAELRDEEARLHGVLVRLLLSGQVDLVREVAGGSDDCGPQSVMATVYRLGPGGGATADLDRAFAAVWRAVLPAATRRGSKALIARIEGDIAVVVLDGEREGGDGRVLALLAKAAGRYRLAGGVTDPAPAGMLRAAWAEAGQARTRAAVGEIAPALRLGQRSLMRLVPAQTLETWASTLLHPLDDQQRRLLEVCLRSTTTQAAADFGLTRHAVRTRLTAMSRLLKADLTEPAVRARLLLALRAPQTRGVPADEPVDPARDCPTWLLDVDTARRWAEDLTVVLDQHLADALSVWLEHSGHAAPAAAVLGFDRRTLARQVDQAQELLEADLQDAGVRAEVYLALMTVRATRQGPLPEGAPGCGDWLTRAGLR